MSNDNINLWNSLCEQRVQIYNEIKNDIEGIIKVIDKQQYRGIEIKSILETYIYTINKKKKLSEEEGK